MNACGEKADLTYKSFGNTAKSEQVSVPFPSGTNGVFYFHDRTNVHPVAGDVRFRILPVNRFQSWRPDDCSQLFAEGDDLLDHDGFGPWRISLLSIIYKQRPVLFELLKQCRYISKVAEMQVEQLRLSVAARRTYVVGLGSQVIDRIPDPFTLNLGSHSQAVVFLQQEGITPHKIFPQQMTNAQDIQRRKKHMAYSGTALVRFEIIRYEGRNRIVLRVLKFLKPPNPNDVVFQEEGELLKKYDPRNQTEKTWMANGKANPKFITPSSMKLLEETYLPKVTI